MHHQYVVFQTLVRTPRASHVKTTKSTTWNPTKINTPKYLPRSSCQRATGLASKTDAALGFQERRDESRGPDQGQEQSQGAGEAPSQEQLEERDGIAALAAHREWKRRQTPGSFDR